MFAATAELPNQLMHSDRCQWRIYSSVITWKCIVFYSITTSITEVPIPYTQKQRVYSSIRTTKGILFEQR